MTEEEIKQFRARFDQLVKAKITPSVPVNDYAPKIFDAQGSDVRKQFALKQPWETLIKEGLLEFQMEGRTISLYLLPDQTNPLLISIQPIIDKVHGEQIILFLGATEPTPDRIGEILHAYLTDEITRTEYIKDSPNYLILPKDLDSADFLLKSVPKFVPEHLVKKTNEED